MKCSKTHSPIINQIFPHHLNLLPLLLHHLLLIMPHHLQMYPHLKKTSLPHPLPRNQIKREVAVNKQMKMRKRVMMNQAKTKKKAWKLKVVMVIMVEMSLGAIKTVKTVRLLVMKR